MDASEEAQAKQMAAMAQQGDQRAAEQQKAKEEADNRETQRKMILKQLLDADAHERLTRIGLVNQSKQVMIENAIIMKVQQGAIQTKLDDSALLRLIEEVSAAQGSASKVVMRRKNDSDDDLDLDDD